MKNLWAVVVIVLVAVMIGPVMADGPDVGTYVMNEYPSWRFPVCENGALTGWMIIEGNGSWVQTISTQQEANGAEVTRQEDVREFAGENTDGVWQYGEYQTWIYNDVNLDTSQQNADLANLHARYYHNGVPYAEYRWVINNARDAHDELRASVSISNTNWTAECLR